MSGLATEENHGRQADSNDNGKAPEDARSTSRGGRRLVKRFFVIVHLGVLAFFITFAIARHHPVLLIVLSIAVGALLWRTWKWERSERQIHGAEDAVQRHLRAQAKRRKRKRRGRFERFLMAVSSLPIWQNPRCFNDRFRGKQLLDLGRRPIGAISKARRPAPAYHLKQKCACVPPVQTNAPESA